MKAQIEEILKENLSITQCGYMNSQAGLDGAKDAAEIIEELMCYREVSIHWTNMKNTFHEWAARDILIKKLSSDYPESMITATIERVKSEQP